VNKNWVEEKPNIFTIGVVVFAPVTQTCATEYWSTSAVLSPLAVKSLRQFLFMNENPIE
jgi:hypothetical protein